MVLNNFIDFKSMFNVLFKEQEEDLEKYKYEASYYQTLLNFVQSGDVEIFELLIDESEINDKEIVFIFTHDFNDANESNNQSTSEDYVIIYNRICNEFTSCKYDAG